MKTKVEHVLELWNKWLRLHREALSDDVTAEKQSSLLQEADTVDAERAALYQQLTDAQKDQFWESIDKKG